MKHRQEDSLEYILKPIPKNLFKKIKWKITVWLLRHPNLWVNPLSIFNIFRALSGKYRVLPDFIIIGAAKSGTTSLYDYLIQHPSIHPALWKEIYFFDRYFPRGMNWYRANFPYKLQKFIFTKILNKKFLTGEATPTYFHHPLAPKRISMILPSIKLIILLRNPIDRAYSHYQMEKKLGYEELTFEEAIDSEHFRLQGESEKMIENPNYFSYNRQIFSYLTSGIYVDQLELWIKYFSKNQFLIIKSEDFDNDPKQTFHEVENFLGLNHAKIHFAKQNIGKYEPINPEIRKKLAEFFTPHNQKLYKFLKRDFAWQ
jgi:hypothetical protein